MRRVVPPREGAVGRQLGLHLVEVRLAHHGRHLPNKKPAVGWLRHGRAMGPANRMRRRAAVRGRAVLRALRINLPRVGRIAQNAPDRRARPARPTRGRGHTARIEMHGEPHQRRSRLAVQGEQLRNHGGLGRVERNAARVARPVGARPIAVRGIGPRQQPAGAQLGEPATPHALGNQVRSYSATAPRICSSR